jgi:hypothetical protein
MSDGALTMLLGHRGGARAPSAEEARDWPARNAAREYQITRTDVARKYVSMFPDQMRAPSCSGPDLRKSVPTRWTQVI